MKSNTETAKEKRDIARIGKEITRLNGYSLTNVVKELDYNAAGDATDWMLDKHGIIAYTPEVGPNDAEARRVAGASIDQQDAYGFWPHADRIPYHGRKSISANIRLAWLSGATYHISLESVNVLESSSENTLDAGFKVKVKNVGLRDSPSPVEISFLVVASNTSVQIQQTGTVADKIKADSEALFFSSGKIIVKTARESFCMQLLQILHHAHRFQ